MYKIIAGNFSAKFIAAVVNLLIAVLVSQLLGAQGKGEQSLIIVTISLIVLFNNFVGGASVVYLTPRNPLKHIVVPSYVWALLVNSCAGVIMYYWTEMSVSMAFSIAVLSGISSFTAVNTSILVGQMQIAKHNIVNVLIPVLTILVLVLLSLFAATFSIQSYILSLYIAYGISFLMSWVYVFKHTAKSDAVLTITSFFTAFKQLLFFGTQNQLAHIFQLLNFRLSYYILEHNSGQAAVGIYSNGISIVESVWMITGSICIYQYSVIANNTDKESAFRLTENLTKLGFFLSLLAILVLVFIPSSFYQWLFGAEFGEISEIILIMIPGIWFFNYAKILGHFFSGIGKYYVYAIASMVGFALTLVLLFVVFKELTIHQAAITASSTYMLTAAIVLGFYLKEGGKLVLFFSAREVKGICSRFLSRGR